MALMSSVEEGANVRQLPSRTTGVTVALAYNSRFGRFVVSVLSRFGSLLNVRCFLKFAFAFVCPLKV